MSKLSMQAARLRALKGVKVEAGWFESNKYPDGQKVAQVAVWNEYGRDNTPARPFMRYAAEIAPAMVKPIAAKAASKILSGEMSVDAAMKVVGQKFEEAIVTSITEGDWAPNSEVTVHGSENGFIKGKGFNRPLVDTSLMLGSVSSVVFK